MKFAIILSVLISIHQTQVVKLPNQSISTQDKIQSQAGSTQVSIGKNYFKKEMENNILIITNDGIIYNYDFIKRKLLWTTDLQIQFHNGSINKTNNPFIPIDRGDFLIKNNQNQIFKIDHQEIDHIFQECNCFQEDLAFMTNQLNYAINIRNGEFTVLNQEQIIQLLRFPQKQQDILIMNVQQKFITNINASQCEQYNSKIQINFLTNFLKQQKNSIKEAKNLKIHKIKKNQIEIKIMGKQLETFQLQTQDDVVDIFGFDEVDNFYSHSLTQGIGLNNINGLNSLELSLHRESLVPFGYEHLIVQENNEEKFDEITNPSYSNYVDCILKFRKLILPLLNEAESTKQSQISLIQFDPQNNLQLINAIVISILFIGLITLIGLIIYDAQNRLVASNNNSLKLALPQCNFDVNQNQKTSTILINQSENSSTSSDIQIENKSPSTDKQKKINTFTLYKDQVIGTGSNGTTIYSGLFMGYQVAIKRIRKMDTNKLDYLREVEVMKSISHQNILHLYHYEENEKYIYLVMERCLQSVRQLVESKEKQISSITSDIFKNLIFSTINALKLMQEKKIIHRDIKPDNILISLDGTFKIADFGISKFLDNNKQTKNIGSIGWRPKEVVENQKYSTKADVFALGCTIYYVATNGQHPFGNQNNEIRIIENRVVDIQKKINDSLLSIVILKMIGRNPEDRLNPSDLLNLPYFWTSQRKLTFIQEFSDYIEAYGDLHDDKNQRSNELQRYCYERKVFNQPWNHYLEDDLFIKSTRSYDFNSSRHLVRFIRNCKNHFHELHQDAQNILGKNEKEVFDYWNNHFPHLLSTLYQFAIFNKYKLLTINL